MCRPCVISLATDQKKYPDALCRLELNLKKIGFDGQFLKWPPGDYPENCPAHFAAPFAFKPFCFMEAHKKGFDAILWLDSAIVVTKPLDDVFALIKKDGHLFFLLPRLYLGQWCSDEALKQFNVARDKAMQIPEINGACIGLDLRNAQSAEFLQKWTQKAVDGITFRGIKEEIKNWDDYEDIKWNITGRASTDKRVRGHRHDQSAAGMIAWQLNMKLQNDGLTDILGAKTCGIKYDLRKAYFIIDRDISIRSTVCPLSYFFFNKRVSYIAHAPLIRKTAKFILRIFRLMAPRK